MENNQQVERTTSRENREYQNMESPNNGPLFNGHRHNSHNMLNNNYQSVTSSVRQSQQHNNNFHRQTQSATQARNSTQLFSRNGQNFSTTHREVVTVTHSVTHNRLPPANLPQNRHNRGHQGSNQFNNNLHHQRNGQQPEQIIHLNTRIGSQYNQGNPFAQNVNIVQPTAMDIAENEHLLIDVSSTRNRKRNSDQINNSRPLDETRSSHHSRNQHNRDFQQSNQGVSNQFEVSHQFPVIVDLTGGGSSIQTESVAALHGISSNEQSSRGNVQNFTHPAHNVMDLTSSETGDSRLDFIRPNESILPSNPSDFPRNVAQFSRNIPTVNSLDHLRNLPPVSNPVMTFNSPHLLLCHGSENAEDCDDPQLQQHITVCSNNNCETENISSIETDQIEHSPSAVVPLTNTEHAFMIGSVICPVVDEYQGSNPLSVRTNGALFVSLYQQYLDYVARNQRLVHACLSLNEQRLQIQAADIRLQQRSLELQQQILNAQNQQNNSNSLQQSSVMMAPTVTLHQDSQQCDNLPRSATSNTHLDSHMEECDSNGTFVAGDNSTSSADFCQQSQQQPAAPQQPQLPAPENTIEQSEQQQRVSECVAKLISTRTNKVKRVAKHRQLQLAQQRHTTNQPNPTILENNNSTSMDVSSSKPVVSSVPTNTSHNNNNNNNITTFTDTL